MIVNNGVDVFVSKAVAILQGRCDLPRLVTTGSAAWTVMAMATAATNRAKTRLMMAMMETDGD